MRTRIWNIVALKLLVAVSVSKAEICESLLYESDVPLAFDTRAYETITTFPGSLIGTCSDRCLRDPSCLAVEICESRGYQIYFILFVFDSSIRWKFEEKITWKAKGFISNNLFKLPFFNFELWNNFNWKDLGGFDVNGFFKYECRTRILV